MFSFGFQQAFQRGIEPGDHVYFSKVCDELTRDGIQIDIGSDVSV